MKLTRPKYLILLVSFVALLLGWVVLMSEKSPQPGHPVTSSTIGDPSDKMDTLGIPYSRPAAQSIPQAAVQNSPRPTALFSSWELRQGSP